MNVNCNIMYRLLRKMYETGAFSSKWICKIKSALDECGMSNIWQSSSDTNKTWFKNCVNLKICDMEQQLMLEEINRNRLCANYRILKTDVKFEKYLTKLDDYDRMTLCKFRCGNHNLPISDRRYLPFQNPKLCNLCQLQEQGDEYHYILKCPFFMETRRMYVKRYYYTRPNCLKFNQLFSSNNIKELRNLAKLVKNILSHF